MSFFQYYFGIEIGRKETAVCCPFPHSTPGTHVQYYEQHPSAHVNLEEGVFHCKACGQGHSELSFISAILGCSYGTAMKLSAIYRNPEDRLQWDNVPLSQESIDTLQRFKISLASIEELHIKDALDQRIAFPVLMYDKLIDIRMYKPGATPKVRSRAGATMGFVIPFDVWRTERHKTTLICAGEKDMAVARSFGFNAITITGGENIIPACPNEFHDRRVVICYDNDGAGKRGAVRLANFLKPICTSVRNCTQFHEVCAEDGEDITDFFVKYNKTREDLIHYLDQAPEHEIVDIDGDAVYPTLDLHTASKPQYVGKLVRSNIQVVATSEATFAVPSTLIGEKYRDSEQAGAQMHKGDIREWTLTEETVQDVLHLMDNNFTETDLQKNYRSLLRIPLKEPYLRFKLPFKETIYKAYVSDMFETQSGDVVPMEYTAYTVGCKLESGKKYLATYKLAPHPYKGQQLTMLITNIVNANDSVSNFQITPEVIEHLKVFQDVPGTVAEKVEHMTERFKAILGYNGNNTLIQTMDFAYHTVLEFDFGNQKAVRGYLDTLIVSESRVGKSSTAEAMRSTYALGALVSLAGNAATIPGLVGGSNKVGGSYQTRAGIIPQNHRGLIIFEELGKSNANIIKELTDIRSSNEVRITRVSGTLNLPATVRMLALTNVRSVDGSIRSIASYPNGISILAELVGTAEDIARYDLICILGDRGRQHLDPFWEPMPAFGTDLYRTRIRWIWSRTATQVLITPAIGRYLIERANELNQTYGCHIKIFGTEAWKKLARLAVAVAGYVVSTDDTYQNIVVLQEHVDYAAQFMVNLYDNGTFKFKEYVQYERMYAEIDDQGVALLQEIYIKQPALLIHLERMASTSKNTLQAVTGMSNDEYSLQMSKLVAGMFVRFSKYDILPTERFRLGMARINRNTRVLRVGEHE